MVVGGLGWGLEVYHEIFKLGSTHPGACGKISGLEGSHHREPKKTLVNIVFEFPIFRLGVVYGMETVVYSEETSSNVTQAQRRYFKEPRN